MGETNVETLFAWLDDTTKKIQQHRNDTYLESLTTTLEILFYDDIVDNSMDDIVKQTLTKSLQQIDLDIYAIHHIRKAVQLAILKGMKGTTQQHHLMTPEAIALLIGYLVGKLTHKQTKLRIFDPVSGTANLLTAVMRHLQKDKQVEAYANEIDPTLLKLSLQYANLQKMEIEFFHQDSLRPFLLDPVDIVIADLPVGYYPDDERAQHFQLEAEEGHSYSHHLLMEQSMNYTKSGGYLLFLIPNFLFTSDQSDQLQAYLQEHAHIVGLLELPKTVFKDDSHAKSIFILQKKGEHTSACKQPLLVQLPSLSNAQAMEDILGQMNGWFTTNLP